MAIANIIKFTEEEPLLIWKWHDLKYSKREDEIRLGSQLVVGENQQAIFVKGGKICDIFETGQYTLSTSNLPIISQIIGSVAKQIEAEFGKLKKRRLIKWGIIIGAIVVYLIVAVVMQ